MLSVTGLVHSFNGSYRTMPPVLDIAQMTAAKGRLTVVSGPSGSGKTTLLYLLAGLMRPSAGGVCWNDVDLTKLGEGARDKWRREHAGFVFQDFNLIPEMSALQNVTVSAYFAGWSDAGVRARGSALLERFSVPLQRRAASTLSRGEQQRVALARALVLDPSIIFADEPTASLDTENAETMTQHLKALAGEGRTVIAVSHDAALIDAADARLVLNRGRIEDSDGVEAA